jgi:hypothetical protein
VRIQLAREQHVAYQLHVVALAPGGLVEGLERPVGNLTGIVHEHVHGAAGGRERLERHRVADIERMYVSIDPELPFDRSLVLREHVGRTRREMHAAALAGECTRNGEADAFRRAGD